MKSIIFSHQRPNFIREEFNLGFAKIKGDITIQSTSSCFSREEFCLGFAQTKGDSQMKKYRALARASVARNFTWALPKQKGTVK